MRSLFKTALPSILPEDDRHAIPGYFWLGGEPGMKSSTHRRRTIGQTIFTQGWSTFRCPDTGCERPFLIRIAKAIDQLAGEAVSHEESLPANDLLSHSYIRREALHHKMKTLLDRGEKFIILEGQVGTGKSRLAWEFALENADPSEVELFSLPHAADSVTNVPYEMQSKLRSLNASLEKIATNDDSPTFMIIEGLDKGHLLSRMLPERTNSTFIITTRRAQSMTGGSVVQVDPLEISEATQMVQSRLPQVTDTSDARQLAKSLGRNVLAIEQGCEILGQNSDLSLQEFRCALNYFAAQVLNTSGNDEQPPLASNLPRDLQEPHADSPGCGRTP